MVRFTVLASGSKGNSCIVSCGRDGSSESTRILVDAGLSCRELFRRMKQAGEDPSALDAILVTHEHQDHINGLAVTARKLGIPVYFTEATHRAWVRQVTPQKRVTYAEWAQQYREQKNPVEEAAPEPETAEPICTTQPESAPDPARLPAVQYFRAGETFSIGDLQISPFTIPHDAADPVGFVFTAEGVRLALATDLGYMP